VFGVALTDLMAGKRYKYFDIPPFLERAFAFLSTRESLESEGLFRLSGQQSEVERYHHQLDAGTFTFLINSTSTRS
jgi:hypothetical protein